MKNDAISFTLSRLSNEQMCIAKKIDEAVYHMSSLKSGKFVREIELNKTYFNI